MAAEQRMSLGRKKMLKKMVVKATQVPVWRGTVAG